MRSRPGACRLAPLARSCCACFGLASPVLTHCAAAALNGGLAGAVTGFVLGWNGAAPSRLAACLVAKDAGLSCLLCTALLLLSARTVDAAGGPWAAAQSAAMLGAFSYFVDSLNTSEAQACAAVQVPVLRLVSTVTQGPLRVMFFSCALFMPAKVKGTCKSQR